MQKSLITEPLGLFGWSYLEPVLLASLASEAPMLIMGKHGSAKSFILERLAEALNLEFRCYNASLINYDDLVGIPVPINNNTQLSYISNASSIWDAEVVFIDELNRTKPELQNKLFPIIYDKRVQGINLNKLKYRWAAMNPPSIEEDEDDITYLGAMPLDPALADRFPYIINAPTWDDLTDKDRHNMLIDCHLGRHEFQVDISKLILETKTEYDDLLHTKKDIVTRYIITLMDLLKNSFGYFSARRATMLEDALVYIWAAQNTLNKRVNKQSSFEDVAYLHIQNTIPNIANEKIDKELLMGICQQALKLTQLDESSEKKILLIADPIERLKELIKNRKDLCDGIINDQITNSLNEICNEKQRRAMAVFAYLSFRDNRNIHAAVMETLANEVRPVFAIKKHSSMELLRIKKIADKVIALLNDVDDGKPYKKYLNNYLCSFLPNDYSDVDEVSVACNFFIRTWEELRL